MEEEFDGIDDDHGPCLYCDFGNESRIGFGVDATGAAASESANASGVGAGVLAYYLDNYLQASS